MCGRGTVEVFVVVALTAPGVAEDDARALSTCARVDVDVLGSVVTDDEVDASPAKWYTSRADEMPAPKKID